MFPYRDDNPTAITPYVTYAIIGLNFACWLLIQGAGTHPALDRSVCQFGLIPGDLTGRLPAGYQIPLGRGLGCVIGTSRAWMSVVTSMFMHGGWLHILGNMWFFWIFGNNIEDAMGHWRFAVFYLICGLCAAGAQVAASPGSAIPMIGASGAISGVMGAYLVLYPRVRVHTLVFLGFFITTVALPAYIMLLYWFFVQFLGGLPTLGGLNRGGVAFLAHVGGFISGAMLIRVFARQRPVPAVEVHTWDGGPPGSGPWRPRW